MYINKEKIIGDVKSNFTGQLPFYVGEQLETGKSEIINFEDETSAFIYGKSGGSKTSVIRNFLHVIGEVKEYKDVNVYIYDKEGVHRYEKEFGNVENIVRQESSLEGFIKMIKNIDINRKIAQELIVRGGNENIKEFKEENIDTIPYNIVIIEGIDNLYEDLQEKLEEDEYIEVIGRIERIAETGRSAGVKIVMTASSLEGNLKMLLANSSLKYINTEIDEKDFNKLIGRELAEDNRCLLGQGNERGIVKKGYDESVTEVKLDVVEI